MSDFEKVKIGELIREEVEARGMKVSHFAKLINRTRQNVHNIFGRNTIDTELLFEISKALNKDFFAEYSRNLHSLPSPENALANARAVYETQQDGVHLHIHLPDSPMSDEDRIKLLSQVQSDLTRLNKKEAGPNNSEPAPRDGE